MSPVVPVRSTVDGATTAVCWAFFRPGPAGPAWLSNLSVGPVVKSCSETPSPVLSSPARPAHMEEHVDLLMLSVASDIAQAFSCDSVTSSVGGQWSADVSDTDFLSSDVDSTHESGSDLSPVNAHHAPVHAVTPQLSAVAASGRLQGERCPHRKNWSRLRAKRGISQFHCTLCGARWRIRAQRKMPGDLVDEGHDLLALEHEDYDCC